MIPLQQYSTCGLWQWRHTEMQEQKYIVVGILCTLTSRENSLLVPEPNILRFFKFVDHSWHSSNLHFFLTVSIGNSCKEGSINFGNPCRHHHELKRLNYVKDAIHCQLNWAIVPFRVRLTQSHSARLRLTQSHSAPRTTHMPLYDMLPLIERCNFTECFNINITSVRYR